MAPVLGYWDVRGLAEPIRFLLNYVGVEFEDKRYEVKTPKPHEMDRTEWLKDKFDLGMTFPNLPYYIDGDVKLSQSVAIMRHLARKYNLGGTTEEEQKLIDVIEQQSRDLIWSLAIGAFNPDFASKKAEYIKNLPDKLKPIEVFLSGKRWLVGDRVTYVDFLMYESLDHHRILDPSCLDQFPNLSDFMNRVEDLPNIKKYMESGRFKSWPLYGAILYWGFYK